MDAGDLLIRVGQDLVRLKPNSEMETIEGFFNQIDSIDQFALSEEDIQTWRAALAKVSGGNGIELAQAESQSTDGTVSDASNAAQESTVIAKVSGISGTAQVIRQGLLMTLSVGDPIYLGDVISSQSNSKVNLFVVKSDAVESTGTGVTIGESTRMMVTGQFVQIDQSSRIFEVNLKVDAGAVSVDASKAPNLNIQVQVPQGQIQVPANGLQVSVETQSGQAMVNVPASTAANVGAVATVGVINASGQVARLQVGQAPVAVNFQDVQAQPQAVAVPAASSTQGAAGSQTVPAASVASQQSAAAAGGSR